MNLKDQKDEIICRKMREQAADLPEFYQDHIKTLIQELPADAQEKKRKYKWSCYK